MKRSLFSHSSRIVVLIALFIASFALLTPGTVHAADYRGYANTAAARLYSMYNTTTGLWSTGWWQSANQLTALIDYMTHGGPNDYSSIIANTWNKNRSSNFINSYTDDTGWWGLAWIRAYDKTLNSSYLGTAKADADYMQTMWDGSSCGGGVWWNTSRNYKNAITIELYIKLNAAYYNRTGDATYRTRAVNGWNWFIGSGMINSSNLVNDGLTLGCSNNGGIVWTYNQGVVLGAAAELHRATNDASYLSKAQTIADAAMHSLVHGLWGTLRENGCESTGCNADQVLFKGIFMRNLWELNARQYRQQNFDFMVRNADLIWANDRNVDQFGNFWAGSFDGNDASRQSSALDAFNSASQYSASPTDSNLAFNRATSANGQCASTQTSVQAVDDYTSTKWCSGLTAGVAWLQVDLGVANVYTVHQFKIYHAGAGGESASYDTRDFLIQGSSDASTWYTLVTVTGNTSNITTHSISNVGFRYFRLYITNPQSNPSYIAARIYEFQVIGYHN